MQLPCLVSWPLLVLALATLGSGCNFPDYGFEANASAGAVGLGGSAGAEGTGSGTGGAFAAVGGTAGFAGASSRGCENRIGDELEADVDCGGICTRACDTGQRCLGDARNCVSGVCNETSRCSAASCQDGVKNGGEADIDCGGGNCKLCAALATCSVAEQCASNLCVDGRCDSGLRVYYQTDIKTPGNTRLRPEIRVVNEGMANVPLPKLGIRYYFSVNDEGTPPVFVSENTSNVVRPDGGDITARTIWTIVAISPVFKADSYFEVSFTADAGALAPGNSVTVFTSVMLVGGQSMTQTNDYSFDAAAATSGEPYARIPLYLDGARVYGDAPD